MSSRVDPNPLQQRQRVAQPAVGANEQFSRLPDVAASQQQDGELHIAMSAPEGLPHLIATA